MSHAMQPTDSRAIRTLSERATTARLQERSGRFSSDRLFVRKSMPYKSLSNVERVFHRIFEKTGCGVWRSPAIMAVKPSRTSGL